MIRHRSWSFPALIIVVGLLLAGCAGASSRVQTQGSSWPGLAPSPSGDAIYVAYSSHIYAYDTEDGDDLWLFPEDAQRGQLFFAEPAVADDLIVVGDYTGNLFGLDPADGSEVWSNTEGGSRIIGGAAIGDDLVFTGTRSGLVFAVDRDTGDGEWSLNVGEEVWSAPLLVEDTLYVTTLGRHLIAIDASSGDELWRFPGEGDDEIFGPLAGTPTHQDGVLYFGSFDREVYAFDLGSRSLQWTYSDLTNWAWSSPVYDEVTGLLIGGDLDGHVYALDPESGDAEWTFEAEGPVVSPPALADSEDGTRVVYLTSEGGFVYILDAATGDDIDDTQIEGEFTQRFLFVTTGTTVTGVPINARPVLANGLVITATHQFEQDFLFALEQDSLREEWAVGPQTN